MEREVWEKGSRKNVWVMLIVKEELTFVGSDKLCTRVCQMKTLNMFYLLIYGKQKVYNDFIFLCSMVLPPVGHTSNHKYHC